VAAIVAALLTMSAGSGSGQSAGKPSAPTQAAPVTQEQIEGTLHVCSSCHGFGGRSISPTFPRLAGQRAEYIETQLKAFRDHTRADPHAHTYMWGMAAHLSDPLIHGIAGYYAAQPPVPGTPGEPAEMAAGKKIFQEGISGVPPCQSCHGEHAEGMGTIPRLAGQHPEYLIEQLQNFASNARANEIMHANSKPLTADEIHQVTAYIAAQ
jgi:cytochrome c553